MKKAILIISLLAFTFASFAQTKKDSLKQVVKSTTATAKKDTVVKPMVYKPNPARLYTVNLDAATLDNLLNTSSAGVVPFYKTTATPMNKLDAIDEYYKSIYRDIQAQVNVQMKADRDKFVSDSLKAVKIKK